MTTGTADTSLPGHPLPGARLKHCLEKGQEEFPLYHSHGQGNLKDDLNRPAPSTPHDYRDEQKRVQHSAWRSGNYYWKRVPLLTWKTN